MPAELSIVIPCFKEKDNIRPLLDKLRAALQGIDWEAIYVDDDSPDGTADEIRKQASGDARVRCLQRIGRRGLSSACIEGMLSSAAPFIAVMDADLQHDETLLLLMLNSIKAENLDVVVGSRYVEGGGLKDWSRQRVAASRGATRFAQALTGLDVQDPMSGFFMLRREYFMKCVRALNGRGFKILLDLLMSSPDPVRFKELPYSFRLRQHGESKLSPKVILDYFVLVMDKSLKKHPWLFWLALGSCLSYCFFLRLQ